MSGGGNVNTASLFIFLWAKNPQSEAWYEIVKSIPRKANR